MYLLVASHLGEGLKVFFPNHITFYSIVPFDILAVIRHHFTSSKNMLLITRHESFPVFSVLYWSYLNCRISCKICFLGNIQNFQSSMLKQWRLFLCITNWWMKTQCIPCMQNYKTNSIICSHLVFLALRYVCTFNSHWRYQVHTELWLISYKLLLISSFSYELIFL